MTPDLTIVILAGGKATRLRDKLTLPVDGEPMLARTVRRLKASGLPCVISVAKRAQFAGIVDSLDCPIVVDALPGQGPLGALATAAAKLRSCLIFAAAADLPNLGPEFVAKLVTRYEESCREWADPAPAAVLPSWSDGNVEPLAALYDREALLRGANAALARAERKVMAALAGLRIVAYPLPPEDEAMFVNVNTPDEYDRVVHGA